MTYLTKILCNKPMLIGLRLANKITKMTSIDRWNETDIKFRDNL